MWFSIHERIFKPNILRAARSEHVNYRNTGENQNFIFFLFRSLDYSIICGCLETAVVERSEMDKKKLLNVKSAESINNK